MANESIKTVILSSGSGANLRAIIDMRYFGDAPNMDVVAVVTDTPDCLAVERCQSAKLPVCSIERNLFPDEKTFCRAVTEKLEDMDTQFVVVADWKYTLPNHVLKRWQRRILCLQPTRLSFHSDGTLLPGAKAVPEEKEIRGVVACLMESDGTIGPILRQREVPLQADDTPAAVLKRIAEIGRELLPEAVAMYCSGRLAIRGRQTKLVPIWKEEPNEIS